MVCSSPSEARLVEQLSEQNAGFKEDQSKEIVESMIDHVGRPTKSTLCLCEGDAPQQSIRVMDHRLNNILRLIFLEPCILLGQLFDEPCPTRGRANHTLEGA